MLRNYLPHTAVLSSQFGEDPLNGKVVEENYNPPDQGQSVQDPQEVLDMTPRNLNWQTLTSVPADMDRQWWCTAKCFIRGYGRLIVVTVICMAIWRFTFPQTFVWFASLDSAPLP